MSFFEKLLSPIADLAGGLLGARSAESAGNKNADLQREFAKNSVQWRVADAKAAGIHPLAALGANMGGASPSFQSAGDYGISAAGQDISRAINANATRTERETNELQTRIAEATLRNWELRNQELAYNLANKSQMGPPAPPTFEIKPAEITAWQPDAPHLTAGPVRPSGSVFNLGHILGDWALPSDQLNEALEDMGFAKYAWVAANNPGKFQEFDRKISDFLEPYTGSQKKIAEAEAAAEALRTWASSVKHRRQAAAVREYNSRRKGWGREAR